MSRKGGEVVKEGYLTKSPPVDKALAGRKRRYFVLWSNGVFEYYTSNAKRPQDYIKTVDLNNCEDMVAPITLQGRENIIRLTVKQGDKVRDYFLEAETRQEMDDWVTLFAQVCGFSPVEEVADYCTQLDISTHSISPTTGLSPRRDLQIRPPITSPTHNNTPLPVPAPPAHSKNRPLPPPKPKRPPEMSRPDYIDPGSGQSAYSVLSPTGEPVCQDGPQATYEEMEYDADEMNRNPPPVWKPPPSPTSSYSIIYSRVERGKILDPHHAVGGSPFRSRHSPKHEVTPSSKALPRPQPYKGDAKQHANKPHPLPKQMNVGAPPPTKPRVTSPTWAKDQNVMKNVLNDPNLMGKLHEKRQELYGAVDAQRTSVSSCESPNPMENYEEICFDLVNNSSEDETASSHAFSRVTNMTLPPRRHNIGSEVAMLQCPPDEKKAQAYLSFHPSPSPSPRHSVSEPEPSTSENLSPRLSSEDQPPLPPRGAERMREGSPRLVRKALPPVADQSRPPERPARSRATEKEDLHRTPHLKPFGQHPQPALSSSDTPPTPPMRNTSCKDVSPPPQPPIRRELHVPMPLPKETYSTQPQPPPRQNRQLPTVSSDAHHPPPVPVRHSASGGSHSTNGIGETPPSRSIFDDAPPVPSRGARQRDVPSLQRPSSMPSSDIEPQVKPRPPVRPTPVGEVHSQQPAPAWDGIANRHDMKPPVTKPRPSKPHPPPVATKPSVTTKPPPNAKPPVSARTAAVRPPLPMARKPVHVPRTGQQNGEFAPPLPPR